MYRFDKNRIIECEERISRRCIEISECESMINAAVKNLNRMSDSEEMLMKLAGILKSLSEQKEKLRRVKYVLEFSADLYSDTDRRALSVCMGERKAMDNFVKKMLTDGNDTEFISVPIDIEIR